MISKLPHGLRRFWSAQRLAMRMLLVFLPLLFVALAGITILGLGAMANLGASALGETDALGRGASADSRTALIQQAQDSLRQLAIDNAQLSDTEFGHIAAETDLLSRYASSLWSGQTLSPTQAVPNPGDIPMRAADRVLAPNADLTAVSADLPLTQQMQPLLASLGSSQATYTWVYIATESGVMQVFPSSEQLSDGYDPRDRAWYQDAMGAAHTVWTDPYVDAAGKGLVITASRQVLDGLDRPVGVVGLDVSNAGMSQRLAEAGLGGQGYAFAIDQEGHVIIAPFLEEGDTVWDQRFAEDDLLQSSEADVRSLATEMVAGRTGVAEVRFPDGVRYVGYAPLKSNDWSIAVVAHAQDIVAPATRTEQLITTQLQNTQDAVAKRIGGTRTTFAIVVVFVLLAAIGVGIAITQSITGPLRKLGVAAVSLEEGKLEDAEIRTLEAAEGQDEVASLLRGFARMAVQVRSREQELRQEVQQLHIEIDHAKAAQEVAEITELTYFQDIQAKARALRATRDPGTT